MPTLHVRSSATADAPDQSEADTTTIPETAAWRTLTWC